MDLPRQSSQYKEAVQAQIEQVRAELEALEKHQREIERKRARRSRSSTHSQSRLGGSEMFISVDLACQSMNRQSQKLSSMLSSSGRGRSILGDATRMSTSNFMAGSTEGSFLLPAPGPAPGPAPAIPRSEPRQKGPSTMSSTMGSTYHGAAPGKGSSSSRKPRKLVLLDKKGAAAYDLDRNQGYSSRRTTESSQPSKAPSRHPSQVQAYHIPGAQPDNAAPVFSAPNPGGKAGSQSKKAGSPPNTAFSTPESTAIRKHPAVPTQQQPSSRPTPINRPWFSCFCTSLCMKNPTKVHAQ